MYNTGYEKDDYLKVRIKLSGTVQKDLLKTDTFRNRIEENKERNRKIKKGYPEKKIISG